VFEHLGDLGEKEFLYGIRERNSRDLYRPVQQIKRDAPCRVRPSHEGAAGTLAPSLSRDFWRIVLHIQQS
jgi:hypothetical protein